MDTNRGRLNWALLHISKQESDNCWWDSFATEFFEDDATLTLLFMLEDGPKRYSKCVVFCVCVCVVVIEPNENAPFSRTNSNWTDADSALLPQHIRGRRHRTVLPYAAQQGIVPANFCDIGLRTVHDDHESRKTDADQGMHNFWSIISIILHQLHRLKSNGATEPSEFTRSARKDAFCSNSSTTITCE